MTVTKRHKLANTQYLLFCVLGLVSLCGSVSSAAVPAQSPRRYALVLENNAYIFNPLLNPSHDAALMSNTLKKIGFEVTEAHNLNREQLFATSRAFSEQLPAGAVALVYYAGHGMQMQNTNYLIPVDMQPTGEQSVPLKAFPLQSLIDHLHAAPSAVNIVILDACRNNPFRPLAAKGHRDFANMGLAKITIPKGTVIAYSTAPGQFADDGQGRRNSLYTETLAQQFQQTGQTIEEILKNVAKFVRKKTLDDQQPWYETSLIDNFYFLPPPGVSMLTQTPDINHEANTVGKRNSVDLAGDWYLSLDTGEWVLLEEQLQNRAKHLTKDEVPMLQYRSKQGNAMAMTTLGLAYREGFVQGRDNKGRSIKNGASNKNSIIWLQKAAEAGFPIAQRELGEMIMQGLGAGADEEIGMQWLERAAYADYPLAKIHYAQRKAGIDPTVEPTAESQYKMMKILLKQSNEMNDKRIEKLEINGRHLESVEKK